MEHVSDYDELIKRGIGKEVIKGKETLTGPKLKGFWGILGELSNLKRGYLRNEKT